MFIFFEISVSAFVVVYYIDYGYVFVGCVGILAFRSESCHLLRGLFYVCTWQIKRLKMDDRYMTLVSKRSQMPSDDDNMLQW